MNASGDLGLRAKTFGSIAEDYESFRPGYPDAAVDWLLPSGARIVADVGAGTGKLTRSLLSRGLEVHAVEPDPKMLALLQRHHPDAHAHLAGADALPLPDESVDAVLVAQAWHWFPHSRAVAETRRVLRPGGVLGLIWNGPARVGGWPAELAALEADKPSRGELDPGRPVNGLESERFDTETIDWQWNVTPEQVRANLATHSGFVVMEPGERRRRLDAAYDIVAGACEAAGTETIPWPHVSMCVRWRPDGDRSLPRE